MKQKRFTEKRIVGPAFHECLAFCDPRHGLRMQPVQKHSQSVSLRRLDIVPILTVDRRARSTPIGSASH